MEKRKNNFKIGGTFQYLGVFCGREYLRPGKIAFQHPAIFPEQLAADHIISWSNPGDIVLDPMCGSGTTCKMALKLGRRFIGIDIAEEYCEIARKRVEAEKERQKFQIIPSSELS